MQKKLFFSKVLQMSATMILFNISSICYGIFISSGSGADAIGIFHLIMSVHSFAVCISISGMSITATRLISDMPHGKSVLQCDDIIKKCMRIALITSSVASAIMFCFADGISIKILKKPECGFCLKLLAPTLICTAMSAVMNGYFTAYAKIGSIFAGKLTGEAVGWCCTIMMFKSFDKDKLYVAVVIATALSAISEGIVNIICYKISRFRSVKQKSDCSYRQILSVATPLALGSYLKTGLVSCENLLVPICLSYTLAGEALGQYGTLKGMSIQILTFPYVFIGAFTSLIIPEIAGRYSIGHKKSIKYISELSIDSIIKLAVFVWTVFMFAGSRICTIFFESSDAGKYLTYLSFLPMFMYIDTVTDAILKGLNKQLYALKINIADSFMRIMLIFMLVPRLGIEGYILIMYISEIINFAASYFKLKKMTNLKISLSYSIIYPIMCSIICIWLLKLIPTNNVFAEILIFGAMYFLAATAVKRK